MLIVIMVKVLML